jgi:hypothetical protein
MTADQAWRCTVRLPATQLADYYQSALKLKRGRKKNCVCTFLFTVIIIREFWMTLSLLWVCVMSKEMARLIRVVEMLRSCQILSLSWSTVNLPFIEEPCRHFLKWYRGSFPGLWQPGRDLTTHLHWWVEIYLYSVFRPSWLGQVQLCLDGATVKNIKTECWTHTSSFVLCLECSTTRHEIWWVHLVFRARSVFGVGSTAVVTWHFYTFFFLFFLFSRRYGHAVSHLLDHAVVQYLKHSELHLHRYY